MRLFVCAAVYLLVWLFTCLCGCLFVNVVLYCCVWLFLWLFVCVIVYICVVVYLLGNYLHGWLTTHASVARTLLINKQLTIRMLKFVGRCGTNIFVLPFLRIDSLNSDPEIYTVRGSRVVKF